VHEPNWLEKTIELLNLAEKSIVVLLTFEFVRPWMDGHCSGLHRILSIRSSPILLSTVHKGVVTVEGKKKASPAASLF
jgi:hypothetical protein